MAEDKKKLRMANWSDIEKDIIIEECSKHSTIINAAVSSKITMTMKSKVWQNITEKLCAVGGVKRTVDQVKTKWKNLRSRSIDTVRQFNKVVLKTGGGGCVDSPSEIDYKICSTVGDEKVTGIINGQETAITPVDISESAVVPDVKDPVLTDQPMQPDIGEKMTFYRKQTAGPVAEKTVSRKRPLEGVKEADIQQARFRVLKLEEEKSKEEIMNLKLRNAFLCVNLAEKLSHNEMSTKELCSGSVKSRLIQEAVKQANIIFPEMVDEIVQYSDDKINVIEDENCNLPQKDVIVKNVSPNVNLHSGVCHIKEQIISPQTVSPNVNLHSGVCHIKQQIISPQNVSPNVRLHAGVCHVKEQIISPQSVSPVSSLHAGVCHIGEQIISPQNVSPNVIFSKVDQSFSPIVQQNQSVQNVQEALDKLGTVSHVADDAFEVDYDNYEWFQDPSNPLLLTGRLKNSG